MTEQERNRKAFVSGVGGGIPIGLAYLVVGFTIGITCRNVGVAPVESALLSITSLASAGEYAGLTVIAADAAYAEIALITLIASARYLLMGCALSQRISPAMKFPWRFLIGYGITDEIFALSVMKPGYLNPFFSLGAILVSAPLWTLGTALGCILGDVLPPILLAAFSVALYGMFISIVVLPARNERAVLVCVLAGWLSSYLLAKWPVTAGLSEGTRTILLTVVIGVIVSLIFPYDSAAEDAVLSAAAEDPGRAADVGDGPPPGEEAVK